MHDEFVWGIRDYFFELICYKSIIISINEKKFLTKFQMTLFA